MPHIQILITGDGDTGAVQVQGPVGDMRIVHWLLGEARRICERLADERDKATANGKIAIVAANALDGLVKQ